MRRKKIPKRRLARRRRALPPSERLLATRKMLGLDGHGSLTRFAQQLGVSPQAINQWEIVPLSRVPQVEQVTGIPRHELRPDFYDPPGTVPNKLRLTPRTPISNSA
ncbi:MAG TPA: YdaS family helix-turn-helix protein [Xanthobacteraceae bacterium]